MSGKEQDNELRETLNQFRYAVSDILKPHHDDDYLMRWLKARNFDVVKAEKMIRKSFKVMHNIGAEDILNSDYELPKVERYFPTRLWGFDKEGSPVRYIFAGKIDYKGFSRSLTVFDCLKMMVCLYELDLKEARENAKNTGKFNQKMVVVFDDTDFSLRQLLDKDVLTKMGMTLLMYQDNFPELLKAIYLINAPPYIQAILAILKPFIHENTFKKIQIFGSDGWQDELLSLVDSIKLPKYYGGDLDDPHYDPDIFLQNMGTIPSSFYLKDELLLKPTDPNIIEITIQERQVFCLRVKVSKIGTILKWVFQSKKNYNIKFGICFQTTLESENESTRKELVKSEFVDSYYIPERGALFCEEAGEYILQFDNTYSWLKKKYVLLKLDLEDPVEELISPC